jgi:copper homeostasis protein
MVFENNAISLHAPDAAVVAGGSAGLLECDGMGKILLEICCGSIDDAIEAERGGADRVELCSALFLGGLTPSIGTIQEVKARLKIPVMVMVRPRGGGFCYTAAEFASMERDVEAALGAGADGIVFGILKEDGKIDTDRCTKLRKRVGDQQSVFHRAFDVTPDGFAAVEHLVEMGITRILTSGQKDNVAEGVDLIRSLIERAGDRIEILPGGGIRPYQVKDVIARTGCRQVHMTAWGTAAVDASTRGNPQVTFGGALYPPEDRYEVTDAGVVRGIVKSCGIVS